MTEAVSLEDGANYYDLLRVPTTASVDEIREAFHRFARNYHPDNLPVGYDLERAQLARMYREGTEAYRILLDPEKRRLYDRGLAEGKSRYDIEQDTKSDGRPNPKLIQCSPRARIFWMKAKSAIKAANWQVAKLNLQLAIQHDPMNTQLKKILDDVVESSKQR